MLHSKREIDVELPARPASSPELRRALRRFLEEIAIDGDRLDDVILAVGEAVGNAIEHAYRGEQGSVRMHAAVAGRALVIEVCDRGRWRLDGDPERGRGLGIMRALVDRVSIENTKTGTSVRLELTL